MMRRERSPSWCVAPRWTALPPILLPVCIAAYLPMTAAGFQAQGQEPAPARDAATSLKLCQQGNSASCDTWVEVLNTRCQEGSGADCFSLATLLEEGRLVKPDLPGAGLNFGRACDLGLQQACAGLARYMRTGGQDILRRACDQNDGASCFLLGSLFSAGYGVPKDPGIAFELFRKSCENRSWRGCGRLGVSYMVGQGTAVNPVLAIASFEKGCQGQNAASCFEAAKFYHSKTSGGTNEPLALQRLAKACNLGLKTACQQVPPPSPPAKP